VEDLPEVDLSKTGSHTFMVQHIDGQFGQFTVEVSFLRILGHLKGLVRQRAAINAD